MPSSLPPGNRRRIGRPTNGDERPCGLCGGTMWFDEQHVVVTRHASARRPAWRCRCGQEVFVRDRRTGAALRADLLELRRALAEVRERVREQRARAITLRQRASESLARAQRRPSA